MADLKAEKENWPKRTLNFRDGAKSSNNLHKLCNKINKEEYL